MSPLLVFVLNVLVLVLIACEMYIMPCARGVNGRFQGNHHHVDIAESWIPPEVVETQPPNSVGIDTSLSALAGAFPWVALMAGLLALPVAAVVCWRRKLFGSDALDCEEDDLEVALGPDAILTLEGLENSEEEEEDDDLESSEEEDEEEEEEETVWLQNQILAKDLLLEKIAAEGTELKREIENLNIDKRKLEDDCELALGQNGVLENLRKEMMDNVASLEHQLEEKDLLLRKKDDEERELRGGFQQALVEKDRELESASEKANELSLSMRETEAKLQARNRELEKNLAIETQRNISLQNEVLMLKDRVQSQQSALRHKESQLVSVTEALNTERAKTEITGAELGVMKNWVSELGGENSLIKEDLRDKSLAITSLRKELGDEQEKTQVLQEEVQVMKNWVSELGAKNTKLKEGLEEALLEVTTLKDSLVNEKREALHRRDQQIESFANVERKLISEKQDLEDKLDFALSHGKELERERSEMRVHYQERLQEKEKEKEKLREREEQLQDNLEFALHQQQNLECYLKRTKEEICSLKRAESINLIELEQLRKECEGLRDKCRMQEENTIKERKHAREYLRMQEEELRNQDRYMLMALLHGTAQRNFYLEHIALDGRNKSMDNKTLDNNSEEAEPHSCVETTEGRNDQGQAADLLNQLRNLEEEQNRKYRNAQREKDDYGKQWEDLTQIVGDLIQGDEQKDC